MHKQVIALEDGRAQITIADERWYAIPTPDAETGLPTYTYLPSVTWIAGYYPKGIAFWKWLANKGWDEAEAVRAAAADKGSRIHQACARLLQGDTVPMASAFATPAGDAAPLSVEEYEALVSFVAWWQDSGEKQTERLDHVVVGDGYAGTLDWLGTIDGERWLIDFKSGQSVWPEHRLQVSAYARALPVSDPPLRLGILQLGYRLNARGWKLTEVEPCYPLFEAARTIWAVEAAGAAPARLTLPLTLALGTPLPNGQMASSRKRKRP